jgi:hypothetical protein
MVIRYQSVISSFPMNALLERRDHPASVMRIYRLYRAEGLAVRRRKRKLPVPKYDPAGAFSQLPAGGGAFRTAKDRFGFLQQLFAVLMQRAILPGQRVGRILHKFPAALVKILAFLYQLVTCVDQIIRNVFSLAN